MLRDNVRAAMERLKQTIPTSGRLMWQTDDSFETCETVGVRIEAANIRERATNMVSSYGVCTRLYTLKGSHSCAVAIDKLLVAHLRSRSLVFGVDRIS